MNWKRQRRGLYQPGAEPQELIEVGNKGLKARTIQEHNVGDI